MPKTKSLVKHDGCGPNIIKHDTIEYLLPVHGAAYRLMKGSGIHNMIFGIYIPFSLAE